MYLNEIRNTLKYLSFVLMTFNTPSPQEGKWIIGCLLQMSTMNTSFPELTATAQLHRGYERSGWHQWCLSCTFKRVQYCLLVDPIKAFDTFTCIHKRLLHRLQSFWTPNTKLVWNFRDKYNIMYYEMNLKREKYLFVFQGSIFGFFILFF